MRRLKFCGEDASSHSRIDLSEQNQSFWVYFCRSLCILCPWATNLLAFCRREDHSEDKLCIRLSCLCLRLPFRQYLRSSTRFVSWFLSFDLLFYLIKARFRNLLLSFLLHVLANKSRRNAFGLILLAFSCIFYAIFWIRKK